MTMEKIAITVPRDVLRKARSASKRARTSLSAYVTRCIEKEVVDSDLEAMLDEMLARSGGPPTRQERQEADRMLDLTPQRKKRK